MKKAVFAIALLLVISGKGQDDSLKKTLHFNSAGFFVGTCQVKQNIPDENQFAQLAPNDTLLKKDFSGYRKTVNYQNPEFYAAAYASFITGKETIKRRKVEFRIGLVYQNVSPRAIEFLKKDSIRQDTFSSSTTGMTVYKDSFVYHNYYFQYRGQKAGIDFTNTFQLNKHPVFSVYAGYNLTLFYSYNNLVQSGYNLEFNRGEWFRSSRYVYNNTTRLKDNWLLSASVPFGCAIRIYKKKTKTIYRGAINVEGRIGITEDKLGRNYRSAGPWFLFSTGIRIYKTRIFYPAVK